MDDGLGVGIILHSDGDIYISSEARLDVRRDSEAAHESPFQAMITEGIAHIPELLEKFGGHDLSSGSSTTLPTASPCSAPGRWWSHSRSI